MEDILKKLNLSESPGELLIKRALTATFRKSGLDQEELKQWRGAMRLSKAELKRLTRISQDWRVVQTASRLPGESKIVFELTQLSSHLFNEALRMKLIHPKMTLEQAKILNS
jgi:hypothetical protein